MKYLHLGCFCLTLIICLIDAKDVRQISKLVPLDDWIDFKNRTRDVKPLDKFIGKLRATYDFVFHKNDNLSNVGKILDKAAKDNSGDGPKINDTDLVVEKEKDVDLVDLIPIDEKGHRINGNSNSGSAIGKESTKWKHSNNYWLDEGFEQMLETLEELEQAAPLTRLELIDDQVPLTTSNDRESESSDKIADPSESRPIHATFRLPYAIAQALLRWLISLYYTASSNHATTPNDSAGTRP